ncbi:MAG: hypothetical protein JO328_05265 [Hyphomicrobiales bacterium]|nr:hypothetical protein [Hyphomicrobiales bacterium]MBV8823588.1 hypothetical protein [Hyphomicrobiales bacterium]MBV9429746.1 hypothetical protein [Bradyrhizobiaceae bacterium]
MPAITLGGRLAVACAAVAMVCAIGATQAQTGTASGAQAQGKQQSSPQGQTGPVNTGSGGAPPESPQGETPPNMQATSPGAAQAPKGK